jgi:hypothetical protein
MTTTTSLIDRIQRRLTTAFIQTQPVTIVLVPHTNVRTGAGGTKLVEGVPRSAQTMRLIEPGEPDVIRLEQDGQEERSIFELLGEWDAELAVGDTFVVDEAEWTIIQTFFYNGYSRRAQVVRREVTSI